MNYPKTFYLTLIVICSILPGINAQQNLQTVTSTGGDAMGQNGSVSYSVGQVFINTPTGITSFLQEGVQQPLEIIIIPGTKDVRGIGLAVHAYPNPVRRTLTLKIHDKGFQEFNFYLCDMNGKILKANKIVNSETFIPMEEYPPSTYYLRVTEGSDEIKLFKIIKTN